MLLFDPFSGFDGLVARGGQRGSVFVPPVDVTVSETDMVLTLDLPGLTGDDIQVEALGGHLFIRGERRRPQPSEGTQWVHAERGFGRFERRVKLPDGIDPDGIVASFENGVLSLVIPKPERLRPRTIAIGGGSEQPRREIAGTTV